MIRANCRERFTHFDFKFITDSLADNSHGRRTALIKLLTDKESRDDILDNKIVFLELIHNKQTVKISPFFYFYILTRHALMENNIDDRDLSDYLASMLAQFSWAQRAYQISHQHQQVYTYLVDMIKDSTTASSAYESFLLRSHLGNFSLFMTGIFPERIYTKSTYGRKALGFEYYEEVGKNNYKIASQHHFAYKFELANLFTKLADGFKPIRLTLNNMVDKYMKIDNRPTTLDRTLRRIFYGSPIPGRLDA